MGPIAPVRRRAPAKACQRAQHPCNGRLLLEHPRRTLPAKRLLIYLLTAGHNTANMAPTEIPQRELTACRTLAPCHQFKTGHAQEGSHFRSQKPVSAVHSQAAPQRLFLAKVQGGEGFPCRGVSLLQPSYIAELAPSHCRQAHYFSSTAGKDPPHSHSQNEHKVHVALVPHATGLDTAVQSLLHDPAKGGFQIRSHNSLDNRFGFFPITKEDDFLLFYHGKSYGQTGIPTQDASAAALQLEGIKPPHSLTRGQPWGKPLPFGPASQQEK